MDLNSLLFERGVDPKQSRVLVMRHVPKEPGMKKALPWLAAERPHVFNAFQQSQYPYAEKQMTQAAYLASFIGHKPKQALFIGLYGIKGSRAISHEEYWKIPENTELRKLGMTGWEEVDHHRLSTLWFDLELTGVLQEWKGKLIVNWPPPERSWTRWAAGNTFAVKAVLEESSLDKGMPSWDELVLTWDELAHLPKSWIGKLSEWRGIYLILDAKDGKSYVGSACGDANLYGRWKNYAASGDGGNKFLRRRKPDKFLFSILELVSPAMKRDDVLQLESKWKRRLHTREFGLNAN